MTTPFKDNRDLPNKFIETRRYSWVDTLDRYTQPTPKSRKTLAGTSLYLRSYSTC